MVTSLTFMHRSASVIGTHRIPARRPNSSLLIKLCPCARARGAEEVPTAVSSVPLVHPRARGGDLPSEVVAEHVHGPSPRLRGRQDREWATVARHGCSPARAGRSGRPGSASCISAGAVAGFGRLVNRVAWSCGVVIRSRGDVADGVDLVDDAGASSPATTRGSRRRGRVGSRCRSRRAPSRRWLGRVYDRQFSRDCFPPSSHSFAPRMAVTARDSNLGFGSARSRSGRRLALRRRSSKSKSSVAKLMILSMWTQHPLVVDARPLPSRSSSAG